MIIFVLFIVILAIITLVFINIINSKKGAKMSHQKIHIKVSILKNLFVEFDYEINKNGTKKK